VDRRCGELINLVLESTFPPRLIDGSDNADPSVGAIKGEGNTRFIFGKVQPTRAGRASLYHDLVVVREGKERWRRVKAIDVGSEISLGGTFFLMWRHFDLKLELTTTSIRLEDKK
jgi:hypothetical protein